jgi:hypothetical protein
MYNFISSVIRYDHIFCRQSLMDPVAKVSNISVQTWHVLLTTSQPPRNDARLDVPITVFTHQWTPSVSLTRVFTVLTTGTYERRMHLKIRTQRGIPEKILASRGINNG